MGSPRQDITLEERMGISGDGSGEPRVYGLVSCLAREYRTSRQFIYSLEKRVVTAVEEALAPRKPGPVGSSLPAGDRPRAAGSLHPEPGDGGPCLRASHSECLGSYRRPPS